VCSQCGRKGHAKEQCWTVIGYPSWHPKAKKFPHKQPEKQQSYKGIAKGAALGRKIAANAEYNRHPEVVLTQQEIEQLQNILRKLPGKDNKTTVCNESEDEVDRPGKN